MARPYRTRNDELDLFRALAHPARRRIITASLGKPCSFDQLCRLVRRANPTVSGHLRILRDAGLLTATRRGRAVFYRANRRILRSGAQWLSANAAVPDAA